MPAFVSPPYQTLTLHHRTQNLFSNISPSQTTIIIHACNTQGVWGAGVALEMKKRFPDAFEAYRAYCLEEKKAHSPENEQDGLIGRCMLTFVTPNPTPNRVTGPNLAPIDDNSEHSANGKIIIANLFTRATYGPLTPREPRNPTSYTTSILNATSAAMSALLHGIVDLLEQGVLSDEDVKRLELRMPKINSGKFMVEWAATRRALEGVAVPEGLRGANEDGGGGRVVVCCLDDEMV